MIISIDGSRIEEAGIEGQNLEDILACLQTHHLPPDRVIGEVLVNGKPYSEDMPHAALEVTRTEIDRLELVTRSPEEIALHFLRFGSTIMEDMLASLPQITEMFRLGDESEANEHYLRFLDALHLLVTMLERVSGVMDIHEDRVVEGCGTLTERWQRLAAS